ncbi:CBS domain-containing protein [Gimibacter soli]|uniref:CBS domain-containing protein n=1 Tax=Gimibacter soli TaxID=3024400 RepID=A0AAF0BKZ5_9PROT|nr:CBS domain-containing protein [Gimibacter soli]WCL53537.1 CBS domain-containing protein [Gimibacter soli]
MNVKQILGSKGSEVVFVAPGCKVSEVSKVFGERRIGAVPVMDKGRLVGIVSERDVVRGLAIRGAAVLDDAVDTLMTRSVATCTGEATLNELMEMMTERRIRHVPVVEDGKLIGIVSVGDVVKERLQETQQEADALKEYIATA